MATLDDGGFLVHRHRGDAVHCSVWQSYREAVTVARGWCRRRDESSDEVWTAEVFLVSTGEMVWSDMYGDLGSMLNHGPVAPGWYVWRDDPERWLLVPPTEQQRQ